MDRKNISPAIELFSLSSLEIKINNDIRRQRRSELVLLNHSSFKKRVIFISIEDINLCIDSIPECIIEESIFFFTIDRHWFFPSTEREHIESYDAIAKLNICYSSTFINYLIKKDKQGLVLWLSENKTWKDISDELEKIQDIYYCNPVISVHPPLSSTTMDTYQPSIISNISNSGAIANADGNEEECKIAGEKNEFLPDIVIYYKPLKLDISWWSNVYLKDVEYQSAFNANGTLHVSHII